MQGLARAVFFCNFPPPVTGQTVGTELVADLLEPNLEVVRLDTSDGRLSVGRSPLDLLRRTMSLLRRKRMLERELERVRPEVLYFVVSGTAFGQLRDAMVVRASRGRVPRIVAHVRSGNYHEAFNRRLTAGLTRSVARGVDRFVYLSAYLSSLSEPYLPASKRIVVPNAIDEDVRFSQREVEAKLEARRQRSALRVSFIANMIPSKGYMDLARALADLVERGGPPVEADFVGAWPQERDRQAFESFLSTSGLETTVRVHGGVSDRAWIKALLSESDVLVLPTYYPVEAQPRSIIEALNAATPVVSTRHASIPEYIEDGANGYLVGAREPREIAAALERLADPAEWSERARAARRSYLELFDPEVIAGMLRSVFLAPDTPEEQQ
jgi:glycosyltransferase involved in cell wall biosynthesis